MRLALVADLHGNRPATEALERDLARQRPDQVWCLGDVVGKGPDSAFTCDWAFAHCDVLLAGNWDTGIAARQYVADKYYWDQLGEERMERLRALPLQKELWLAGRRLRLIHGRPVMRDLLYPNSEAELLRPFLADDDGGRWDGLIYADIHRQGVRTLAEGMVVNVGSVGNAIGVPRCCYALLEGDMGREPGAFEVRLRQLEYDRERAMRDARESPGLRFADAYQRELLTGQYSRGNLPPEVKFDEAKK